MTADLSGNSRMMATKTSDTPNRVAKFVSEEIQTSLLERPSASWKIWMPRNVRLGLFEL